MASNIPGLVFRPIGTILAQTLQGFSGNLSISGDLSISGNLIVTGNNTTTLSDIVNITNGTTSTGLGTGSLIISGGLSIGDNLYVNNGINQVNNASINSFAGSINISNATPSTSYSTGSLVTAGGIGTNSLYVNNGINQVNNASTNSFAGPINISNVTQSTSYSTGSLVTAGGIGTNSLYVNNGINQVNNASTNSFAGPMTMSTSSVTVTANTTLTAGSNIYYLTVSNNPAVTLFSGTDGQIIRIIVTGPCTINGTQLYQSGDAVTGLYIAAAWQIIPNYVITSTTGNVTLSGAYSGTLGGQVIVMGPVVTFILGYLQFTATNNGPINAAFSTGTFTNLPNLSIETDSLPGTAINVLLNGSVVPTVQSLTLISPGTLSFGNFTSGQNNTFGQIEYTWHIPI